MGGTFQKITLMRGGGHAKKIGNWGGHTIFKLHSSKSPQPPLPHKKRMVPNAGYPNYIMHRLCAEFHALLACVHIKEKNRFLWGLACEKDKLYFSSEASIGVNQLVIMIWKLESYITLTLNINFSKYNTVLTGCNTEWYFWEISNLMLRVRTDSYLWMNGFELYFLLFWHHIPEVPWRVMTPKVPSANNCLTTVGGSLLSSRQND